VLARDGELNLTTANDDLKTSLSEEINTKKMITDYVCIRNGNILLVDIVIDLTIDKFYKKMKEEFNLKIKNKTNNFFSLYNWEYGQTLRDVDLIKHLSEIREVKRFDISFVTNDPDNSGAIVTSKFNEIIRPDTITISFLFE
jgi:hypothetical protein